MTGINLHQPMGSSTKALSGIFWLLQNRRPQITSVSFNRPNDTTEYSSGDALVSPPPADPEVEPEKGFAMKKALSYSGSGVVVNAKMIVVGVTPTTKPDIDLMIFSSPLETAPTDNSPPTLSETDILNYIATVPFSGSSDAIEISGHTLYETSPTQIVKSASTTLYVLPIIKNLYTPTAEERYVFSFGILPRDYFVV